MQSEPGCWACDFMDGTIPGDDQALGDVVERTGRKCEGQWSDRALLDGVVHRGIPLRLK